MTLRAGWLGATGPRLTSTAQEIKKIFNTLFAGKEAFTTVGTHGYRYGNMHLRGQLFRLLAHRVVFALENGFWPAGEVDHDNTRRGDNSPGNLRDATSTQNHGNTGPKRNNKLGVKGVMQTPSGRFVAQMRYGKRSKHLGTYDTVEAAGAAYERAAIDRWGVFARVAK